MRVFLAFLALAVLGFSLLTVNPRRFSGSSLTLEKNGEKRVVRMERSQAFYIPPLMIHRLEALEDSELPEVLTTELEDVVRLEDRYRREGTNLA